MLAGARRQWPASCDESDQGAAAHNVHGDHSSRNADGGVFGDLSDAADALNLGRPRQGVENDGSQEVGVGFNGCDEEEEEEEGRLWLVGDQTTIADIAVADLVSSDVGGLRP